MKKNFVTFYSPGTFLSEQTTKEIDSWDIHTAVEMAKDIKERYDAVPYGFEFIEKSREENDLDSHTSKTSNFYFLGGEIFTLEQIKEKNDPDDRILISNMENNNYKKVIVNTNSWKAVLPFKEDSIVLITY
jgi:hypothetical protein